jgi:hypothetical protein
VNHGLFVLGPVERQVVADFLKRLAKAGDISVAKNTEHPGKESLFDPIALSELRREILDDGLCDGEAHGCHEVLAPLPTDAIRMFACRPRH